MATFWGVHIYGKDVMKEAARLQLATEILQADPSGGGELESYLPKVDVNDLKFYEMMGIFFATTGAGLGLLAFGPICQRVGRRRAFRIYHLMAVIVSIMLFQFQFPWRCST